MSLNTISRKHRHLVILRLVSDIVLSIIWLRGMLALPEVEMVLVIHPLVLLPELCLRATIHSVAVVWVTPGRLSVGRGRSRSSVPAEMATICVVMGNEFCSFVF